MGVRSLYVSNEYNPISDRTKKVDRFKYKVEH